MRKLLFIIFAVILLTTSAFATEVVYDNADLFSDYEEDEIIEAAYSVYEENGLLCIIVTDYGIGDILNELPVYADGAIDMVMLTIDMSAREFELYQYNSEEGESSFRISYSESESILDRILDDMADGYYADAALTFVDLSASAFVSDEDYVAPDDENEYEYIEYSGPAYEYETETVFSLDMVLLPLLAGLVIAGITVLCVRGAYKKKVHGSTYPLLQYSKLTLTNSNDNFVSKSVVVTRIPDPPSSSGGGRSGGFGGGGGGARMGGRKF